MRTLVISDIHNRTRWIEHFLKHVPHDEVCFLGDYFDSPNDGPARARETAEWLRFSVHQPKRIHCFGNHDMAYAFPSNPWVACDGWTREKSEAVKEVMRPREWARLVLFYETQGWVLSHAGVDTRFAHPIHGWGNLKEQVAKALKIVSSGGFSPWLGRTGTRGGYDLVGGITWQDFRDHQPDQDLKQVVGHTFDYEPRVKQEGSGETHCLDTYSMHYGIIEDGKFSVAWNVKNIEDAHRK